MDLPHIIANLFFVSIGSLNLKIYFLPVNSVTKNLMGSEDERSENMNKFNGFEIQIYMLRKYLFLLFQAYPLNEQFCQTVWQTRHYFL